MPYIEAPRSLAEYFPRSARVTAARAPFAPTRSDRRGSRGTRNEFLVRCTRPTGPQLSQTVLEIHLNGGRPSANHSGQYAKARPGYTHENELPDQTTRSRPFLPW